MTLPPDLRALAEELGASLADAAKIAYRQGYSDGFHAAQILLADVRPDAEAERLRAAMLDDPYCVRCGEPDARHCTGPN